MVRKPVPLLLVLAVAACPARSTDPSPVVLTPAAPAAEAQAPAPPPPPAPPRLDPRLAVQVGDCETVRTATPADGPEPARLALAWCVRTDDPTLALRTLEGLDGGLLGGWARRVRAEALLALQRPADALVALDGLALPGAAAVEVRLLRDRALVDAGRGLEARDDLRALLETSVADEARFLLAEAASARDDVEAAVATWRKVWAESTRGPWSDRAAERLRASGRPTPDLSTPEGRALATTRVAALHEANRHEDALELLLRLEEASGVPLAPDALGRAAFRARDYARAVDAWTRAYGRGEAAKGPPGDLFDLAVASLRAGDRAGSEAVYRALIAQHPKHAKAEEALFKLAWVPYDAQQCDTAVTAFDRYLATYPTGSQASTARWFRGWCAWRGGRRDEAVAAWAELLAKHPGTSLTPSVRYWTARAKGLAGDAEGERAGLEAVLRDHPTSGHAWLAAARLGRTFPTRPDATPPAWPADLALDPAIARATALEAAGLTTWARAELSTVLGRADDTREGALAAAHALVRAGDARAAAKLAEPYCVAPWRGGDPVAQQACHGRPAADVVTATAARYDLNPLLPYAIMHSESGMDPDVTSYAGARGLMQIMPFEGPRLLAEALGHGEFHPDQLYRAPYNALLGTTLLGLNRRTLEGTLAPDELPAVIASYNGGVEAVQRWVHQLGPEPVDFDVFAEEVGFTQTRLYVRGVLGHLMTYRWVYGDR